MRMQPSLVLVSGLLYGHLGGSTTWTTEVCSPFLVGYFVVERWDQGHLDPHCPPGGGVLGHGNATCPCQVRSAESTHPTPSCDAVM